MNQDFLNAIEAKQGEPLYSPEDLIIMSDRKLVPLMRSLDKQVRSIVSVRLEPIQMNAPESTSSNLMVTNDMFGMNNSNSMGETPFEKGNSGYKRKADDTSETDADEDGAKKSRLN